MSCPYYTWRYDFYCTKQHNYVNEDVYYKYCRNYDYSGCPVYGDAGSSTGCFLTSACVEAMNLPDDCEELMILRKFRDTWLVKQPGGQAEIREYYRIAPEIVNTIQRREDRQQIFQRIYDDVVCPCVLWIKQKQYHKAWKRYRNMVETLKKEYG